MTRCSVLPVTAALHGHDVVAEALAELAAHLDTHELHVVSDVADASPDEPLTIFVVTGGTEQLVLDAWAQRQAIIAGEPLVLLTRPEHNSLPAALEALARLQHDGARARIVMLHPGDDPDDRVDIEEVVHDVAVWHALHQARIGLVGTPSDWLVASVPLVEGVRRRWGTEIVDVSLSEVIDRFEENIEAPIAVPVRLRARPHDHSPHPADIETAARVEPVLRDVVEERQLDAIAVRCFDLVTTAFTSGCLALSALNDRGVIAGCEGDVASTMGLLWTRSLTGRPGWMANPAGIDRTTGVIELAHCTVPLSMVEGYQLETHFESDLGVGIVGELPPGPVTLARLGGDELEHLWCADGQALVTPRREERCRTQLDVRIPPGAAGELLDHPLGNHLIVIYGHHADHLRAWWREMVAD